MAADPDRNRIVGDMLWTQEPQRVRRRRACRCSWSSRTPSRRPRRRGASDSPPGAPGRPCSRASLIASSSDSRSSSSRSRPGQLLDPRQPLAQRVRVDEQRPGALDHAAPLRQVALERVQQRGARACCRRRSAGRRPRASGPAARPRRRCGPGSGRRRAASRRSRRRRAAARGRSSRRRAPRGRRAPPPPRRLAQLADADRGTRSGARARRHARRTSSIRSGRPTPSASTARTGPGPASIAARAPAGTEPAPERLGRRAPLARGLLATAGRLGADHQVRARSGRSGPRPPSPPRTTVAPAASASNRSLTMFALGQPLDQLGALDRDRGEVGDRARELGVLAR